jgi:hypothetical protein
MTFPRLLRYVPILVPIVGLFYWLTLPAKTLSIDRNCKPESLADRMTEALHPRAFWRAQLAALRDDRQIQERQQATSDYDAATNANTNKIVTPIERKMDRLSERAAVEEAETQQKARLDRIEWLAACEAEIAGRLGH